MQSQTMIQFYPRYKQFKALLDAKDYGKTVRCVLDYLRFVADEYIRLEVYAYQECDGDDFLTYEVAKELVQVLRNEATPIESVAMAQKEMAEIEKMEAYDDCCLCFFDNIREDINFRLADADTYLADLDKQIKHHTYEYKRLVNNEFFDQLSSVFRFEELGKLLIKKIEYLSYAKLKSYGYIVDDIKGMYTCCEVSKKLILDFVEEIECNYGNRPTLMRLLRS